MNLNNDIIRYGIPHRCNQCAMNYSCNFMCHNKPNPMCGKFIPDNMDSFLNDVIQYFSAHVDKSTDKRLKRVCTYQGATNDKITPLDAYYVGFINDCIFELRKGKMVYVFKLSHVWEILKFVDNITAKYQDDGIIGLVCSRSKI